MRKIFLVFSAGLIAIGYFLISLQAEEVSPCVQSSKKYQLSIGALFKNEARYLREWIEYHRLVGVDHFYLYDNGSQDGCLPVLRPYIREGIVTLTHWPDRMPSDDENLLCHWALSTQLPAYEHALKSKASGESQWIIFLDVDEFLVPVQAHTVPEMLARYNDCSGLALKSDHFDASAMDVLPTRDLLISAVELTAHVGQNVDISVDKTLFRPEDQISFTWPPYKCHFKQEQRSVAVGKNELRINKYVNRSKGVLHFGKNRQKLFVDSRLLTENEMVELLDLGFKIEDKERAIGRFETPLRRRVGLETGWNW